MSLSIRETHISGENKCNSCFYVFLSIPLGRIGTVRIKEEITAVIASADIQGSIGVLEVVSMTGL